MTDIYKAAQQALEHRSHLLKAVDDQVAMLTTQRDELLALLRIVRGKHACGALTLPPADLDRIDAAIAKVEGGAA